MNLQRLKIWWRARKIFSRYVAPMDPAVEWTKEDAGTLHRYLSSPYGRKFRQALENQEAGQNAAAVLASRKDHNLEYAAGMAAGFRAAHALIISLSGDLSRTEANNTDEADEEGEAALIEKLSP